MLEPLGRRLGGDHALLAVTGNDARKDDIDADMVGAKLRCPSLGQADNTIFRSRAARRLKTN